MEEYRGEIQGRYTETSSFLLHLRPPSGKATGAASAVATGSLFKRSPIGALFAARSQFILGVSPSGVSPSKATRAAGEAARNLASEAAVIVGALASEATVVSGAVFLSAA